MRDYSRHPCHSRFGTADSRQAEIASAVQAAICRNFASGVLFTQSHHQNFRFIAEVKNFKKSFPPATLPKPYFCLDTSLNRTLAYAHWCNRGNVLESINVRSYSRFAGETVSARGATILRRTFPSLQRSGPAYDLDPIDGGRSFSPDPSKARLWRGFRREAVCQNIILRLRVRNPVCGEVRCCRFTAN